MDIVPLVKDFGLPIALAIVFAAGSCFLIHYLLVQTKDLGVRMGNLESEYRGDLKGLIEKTSVTIEKSNEVGREVVAELKACRDRHRVA